MTNQSYNPVKLIDFRLLHEAGLDGWAFTHLSLHEHTRPMNISLNQADPFTFIYNGEDEVMYLALSNVFISGMLLCGFDIPERVGIVSLKTESGDWLVVGRESDFASTADLGEDDPFPDEDDDYYDEEDEETT